MTPHAPVCLPVQPDAPDTKPKINELLDQFTILTEDIPSPTEDIPTPLSNAIGTFHPEFATGALSSLPGIVPAGVGLPETPSLGQGALQASVVPADLLPDPDLISPPLNRLQRNLQLPSFDTLGIATPHPDKLIAMQSQLDSPWQVFRPAPLPSATADIGGGRTSLPTFEAAQASPPLSTPSLSPDQVQPGHIAAEDYVSIHKTSSISDTSINPLTSRTLPLRPQPEGSTEGLESIGEELPAEELPLVSPLGSPSLKNAPWMQKIIDRVVESIGDRVARTSEVKMVCQALPTPSIMGHAYPALINALYQRLRPKQIRWMNVFHAVPGTMNLSDLPSSPPTTPAAPHEAEDYFAMSVFDSAVAVPDYQQRTEPRSTVFSPKPAVSPGSADITMLERYIPPTSAREFDELFFEHGHSLLSDRLLELGQNGVLIFIYPTQKGGKTFTREYLGPIIDPLLRKLMISENLHGSLLDELGSMPAVKDLLSFEDMQARVQAFCSGLTASTSPGGSVTTSRPKEKTAIPSLNVRAKTSTSPEKLTSAHQHAEYLLLDAFPYSVHPTKKAWAEDWWVKQEKPRIRRIVADYLAKNSGMRQREGAGKDTPLFAGFEMVETILNGVKDLKYADPADAPSPMQVHAPSLQVTPTTPTASEGEALRPHLSRGSSLASLARYATGSGPRRLYPPTSGIEVGVFLIKKSAPSAAAP